MVVAGAPEQRLDHAEAIATSRSRSCIGFQSRRGLGMHWNSAPASTGAVVAGVIGKKEIHVRHMGDTVNLAARLEAHGIPVKFMSPPTFAICSKIGSCSKSGVSSISGRRAR
jgi:class 3 adenylate cyclase